MLLDVILIRKGAIILEKTALHEYLRKVMELETDIYMAERTISELNDEKSKVPTREVVDKPKYLPIGELPEKPNFLSRYTDAFCKPNALQIGITAIAMIAFWVFFDSFFMGLLIAILAYVLAAAIPTVGKSDLLSENYNSQMERVERIEKENIRRKAAYNRSVELADKKYQKACEKKPLVDQGLDIQIAELSRAKMNTREALQKLYDLDIVYVKYRSIVPISRFCEYMESGRRDVLEGAGGMYDLYEQELMAKTIVGGIHQVNQNLINIGRSIVDVSRQLAGVQHNQMLLYEAVSESNKIAKDIRKNTSEILEKNAEMAVSMKTVEERATAMQSAAETTNSNIERMRANADDVKRYAEYDLRQKYGAVPKDPW